MILNLSSFLDQRFGDVPPVIGGRDVHKLERGGPMLLMEEIRRSPVEVGSLSHISHSLQCFFTCQVVSQILPSTVCFCIRFFLIGTIRVDDF